MIKGIKRRFILLTMAALLVTLLITYGSVYGVQRRSVTREADLLITLIAENGGTMPGGGFYDFGMNEETRYATRYYVIWTDANGTIYASNMKNISVSTAAQIGDQMTVIFQRGKSQGYVGQSRYAVYSLNDPAQRLMTVVLDRSENLRTLHLLGTVMCITGGAVLVIVFVLLLWLSRYAVRPYERNQEKQRRFITDAGHELKTPLAIISSNAEVLEMMNGENKWLSNIKAQTGRITHLVGSMIELSRADEEWEKTEERQTLDLTEIVRQTVESFSAAAQTRGIALYTEIEANVRITGYLEDMTRLAGILLDNAVKYTDARGLLRVMLTKRGRRAILAVENSCAGLDRNTLPHLFDRFYRADPSRSRETGGYGIGLSMAQMLVQRQKGKLTVDYSPEELIRFTAEL